MVRSLCVDEPMTMTMPRQTTRLASVFQRIVDALGFRFGRRAPERDVQPDLVNDEHSLTADALRTPLTSIRSFSEIVLDNPNLSPEERAAFLEIVVQESERLEKAIDAVLHEEDKADEKAA